MAKNGDYCSESAVTHAQVRALDSPCKTPFLAQKSFREQVALESTQAIESKQTQCNSKIVEKNAENVFGSQLVGGRIFLKKHRLTPSGIPCFDEKAGLCSGEQGDKTCGLSPQGDTNSLLYRKKPTPEPNQAESLQTQKLSAKTLLTLGIIFNLCLLGIFKYTDFFLENFNLFSKLLALDFTIPLPHILLPLALSFVTFQQIAFLVDCYKQGKEREETKKLESNIENNAESKKPTLDSSEAKSPNEIPHINFLDYCLFITFFPQLIAGPIVHHREMMPQFYAMTHPIGTNNTKPIETKTLQITIMDNKPSIINWEYIAKGLFIFSIGLFKKVVIADSFAKWANAGFSAVENGAILNCLESWATSLSYTFQLYFDFSGYCDMAIGLGLLFGIVLPINFSSPYKALNIAAFWRNWHITLGRFLKEYLYIPLGGNQNLAYRQSRFYVALNNLLTLRNLFIVAFLSGVWHGAGWGFVIWGSLHGVAMVVHRIYMLLYKKLDSASLYVRFMQTRIYILLCWILTFNFINIAWVFFRAENLQGAVNLLQGMFFGEAVWLRLMDSGTVSTNSIEVWGWIFLAFILALGCQNSVQLTDSLGKRAVNIKLALAGVAFVWVMCVSLESSYVPKFLYFNF